MWPVFFVIVLGMLAVDMFLLGGQKAHRVSTKEAICQKSGGYRGLLAFAFGSPWLAALVSKAYE